MASRLELISQERLDKVTRLRHAGIDPYPNRYPRTHTARQAADLLTRIEGGETQEDRVLVAGRIMANRSMGKSAFMDIRDSSGKIQLLFTNIKEMEETRLQMFKDLDIGDFIGIEGAIARTRTGEPTVKVENWALLSKSLLPLPDKWHGVSDVEVRYRQRYVDLISNNDVKEMFKVRSRIISAVRRFLDERDFLEVETPVLHPSAGGALAAPFITHHNALDQDFYLRIALELHLKRLIVGGFDKVYEIGRVFRNEAISARSHCIFHQVEGLYIDKNVSFADLRQTLFFFAQEMFGRDTKIRLRPSYFPFTEPSAEMDVSCSLCGGKGCTLCKHTGWLEILGCGMVDPNVLDSVGIDSQEYTGFAFGMGIERIALLKYGIRDIRLLFENDVRFLKQFEPTV